MIKIKKLRFFSWKLKLNIHSIRLKLILVFLVPVVFLIFLGLISYRLASKGLVENYESNAIVSLTMMGEYYELGLDNIAKKTIQLTTDDTVQKYYSGYYSSNPTEEANRKGEVQKKILSVDAADQFISDIYVFANYGYPVASVGNMKKEFYETFLESEEAGRLKEAEASDIWLGNHLAVDQAFPAKKQEYAITYIRKISNSGYQQIGYVVVDIDQSFILDLLTKTDFGSNSITGFTTNDGKSVLSGAYKEGFNITKEAFYQKALSDTVMLSSEYVDFMNESYLFLYSKLNLGNSMVFALIPKTEVVQQAEKVKIITDIVVIITSIIALGVGLLISSGIGSTIHKTNEVLSVAATGNLTVEAKIRRKDEFRKLSQSINHMLASMRTLIEKTLNVSKNTAVSAQEVTKASELLMQASQNIVSAVTDIELGVQQQATDAENCLLRMSELAKEIAIVQDSATRIEEIAGDTKVIVSDGLNSMKDLSDKQRATSMITQTVITDIEKLEQESTSIMDIIQTMNEITEQTNLLSLNAMIEAARAGANGRGFAVVADEIRKLAEKSAKEALSIKRVIENIQKQTKETVHTAKKAEAIVAAQDVTLHNTMINFDEVNLHVEKLTDNLSKISQGIDTIGKAKDDTLTAIESISSTLEETVAASAEVSTTAENQLSSVEQLNEAAVRLDVDARNLKNTVSVFQI